ncbi:M16 family metallopeptidase, partial [Candidatus Dependentiae bacterium]
YVQKRVLSNGMTVLVREVHNIPKVSMQVFYNVGSKDEKTGEKGIAHLIEHMVFKGTDKLSEMDINATMHKLSGTSNAFTSYDYTGYLFNLPTQHWKEAFPIMAECMTNCAFKDDHLNSEMKAVIQEMKMYRDDYTRHLVFEMLTLIFPDHPYHYPIIGHKQDLYNVRGKDLLASRSCFSIGRK